MYGTNENIDTEVGCINNVDLEGNHPLIHNQKEYIINFKLINKCINKTI